MYEKGSNFKNNTKFITKYLLRISKGQAFALPQILVLAIGLAFSLVGLMNLSINRLSTSKLSNKEMQAKNASLSAFNSIKTLFNNSKSGAYYYYWLLKTCSSKVASNNVLSQCPTFGGGRYGSQWPGELQKGVFRDPSKLYWSDSGNQWCVGNTGQDCQGRAVAPSCFPLGRNGRSESINWNNLSFSLNHLLSTSKNIESSSNSLNLQSFEIKSTDFNGGEDGGENSIVIEGFNSPSTNKTIKNASNKIRANIKVNKIVPDSGFAFLSVGENFNDTNSLFLGDFNLNGTDQKGSIIWRKHINPSRDYIECPQIRSQSGIRDATQLPNENRRNGGLWVQPLKLPTEPDFPSLGTSGNPWNLQQNPVICLRDGSTNYFNPNCTFLESTINQDKSYAIDDLVVRGKDAYFGISTNDNAKLTLIVRGSIDVSNGGKICHRHNRGACGTGKPENLTIIFKQPSKNTISKQRLSCSASGGLSYKTDANKLIPPNHENNTPFNTLNLSTTGRNSNEAFSAFIYAPDTTFSTSNPNTKFYSRAGGPWELITSIKGVYAHVQKPDGSISDRTPRLIRNINQELIPYTNTPDKNSWDRSRHGFDDTFIIASGSKNRITNRPEIDRLMDNMMLVFDSVANNYFLVGYKRNFATNEIKFVENNIGGQIWKYPLGSDPRKKDNAGSNQIIHYFGIEIREVSDVRKEKYFKGLAWVKNACFDNYGKITWDFNKDYKDKLIKRYDPSYNYGVPYYRGQAIQTWDTLRSFN